MGQSSLWDVLDRSGTLGMVRNGSGDPRDVLDGSADPWGGPEQFVGPSGRSLTGQRTLRDVLDGSGDPWAGLGRMKGPSGRSGTG